MTKHPAVPREVDSLRTQIGSTRTAFAALRLRYANLVAAARVTLTADQDGDPDALEYLRDELSTYGQLPPIDPSTPPEDAAVLTAWLTPNDLLPAEDDGGRR